MMPMKLIRQQRMVVLRIGLSMMSLSLPLLLITMLFVIKILLEVNSNYSFQKMVVVGQTLVLQRLSPGEPELLLLTMPPVLKK